MELSQFYLLYFLHVAANHIQNELIFVLKWDIFPVQTFDIYFLCSTVNKTWGFNACKSLPLHIIPQHPNFVGIEVEIEALQCFLRRWLNLCSTSWLIDEFACKPIIKVFAFTCVLALFTSFISSLKCYSKLAVSCFYGSEGMENISQANKSYCEISKITALKEAVKCLFAVLHFLLDK